MTTAAVAWVGRAVAGLPLAAAITLDAIVAPPDAVAANAVMNQFNLPRRTLAILRGEGLLNDSVSLLIFGAAMSAAVSGSISIPRLAVAAPMGFCLGSWWEVVSVVGSARGQPKA